MLPRTLVRPALLAVATLIGAAPTLEAQTQETVRFFTNHGNFDVMLNPTGNPDLEPLVLNFLLYVNSQRYDGTVINRSQEDFVVQMGSFVASGETPDTLATPGFGSIQRFDPVIVDDNNDGVIDFDTTGLTNVRGTVALALSAGNPNSGSSSFFVNLVDNTFLDSQGFVPFAEIVDMAPLDKIDDLPKANLSAQVSQPGSLAYSDIPVVDDEFLVIDAARVIPEPSAALLSAIGLMAASRRRGSAG